MLKAISLDDLQKRSVELFKYTFFFFTTLNSLSGSVLALESSGNRKKLIKIIARFNGEMFLFYILLPRTFLFFMF